MLATAVGSALTKHMHELLDLMFAYGLSESLVLALQDLATNIPPLLPTIQGVSKWLPAKSWMKGTETSGLTLYRKTLELALLDSCWRTFQDSRRTFTT